MHIVEMFVVKERLVLHRVCVFRNSLRPLCNIRGIMKDEVADNFRVGSLAARERGSMSFEWLFCRVGIILSSSLS
jgi:hypothetical protein